MRTSLGQEKRQDYESEGAISVTLGKKVIGVQKWNMSVRSRISEIRQDTKFMLDLERINGISKDRQKEGRHLGAQIGKSCMS